MSRHTRRTEHLGPPDGERAGYTGSPLCGGGPDAQYRTMFTRTIDADHSRVCSKCQAIHYAAKLAADFPGVTLHKTTNPDDEGKSYKSYRGVHEVRVGGVLRGYVCSENGWGAGYTIHHAVNRDTDGAVRVDYGNVECPTGRIYQNVKAKNGADAYGNIHANATTFGSKEHAAYAMCLRILARAVTGWGEFHAPMEPQAYLVAKADHERKQAERKEQRRQQTVADMGDRIGALGDERERVVGYIERLRCLNHENASDQEAVEWARGLAIKDLARIDAAIVNAQSYKQRAEEGRDF